MLPQSMIGALVQGDGVAQTPTRKGRTNAQVVTDAHGRFHEAASRLKIFFISNGFLGVTSAAAWLTPVAAAAATLLTLYNPGNSGVLASILQAKVALLSGTTEVGEYVWNYHVNTTITATPNAVSKCTNIGAAGAGTTPAGNCRGFANTALTGGVAGLEGPPIQTLNVATGNDFAQPIDGSVIVPQQCAATIGAPTNGTSAVVYGAILYEEVPIPSAA